MAKILLVSTTKDNSFKFLCLPRSNFSFKMWKAQLNLKVLQNLIRDNNKKGNDKTMSDMRKHCFHPQPHSLDKSF